MFTELRASGIYGFVGPRFVAGLTRAGVGRVRSKGNLGRAGPGLVGTPDQDQRRIDAAHGGFVVVFSRHLDSW